MCKVMMFSNGKHLNKNIRRVTNKIAELITAVDDDGFGWLGVDTSKKVFGEKSTDPALFHSMMRVKSFSEMMNAMPRTKKHYAKFGDIVNAKLDGPLLYHGRTSTNDKTMRNTHPISRDGWHVIHNGVVTNHGTKYKKATTNDSEDLVYYMANEGIERLTSNLTGYYAAGLIDPAGRLHVIKDAIASLVCSYIPQIESYVFATTDDLIEDFCEAFKLNYEPINKVLDDTYLILEGNDIVEFKEIKSAGMYSRYEEEMMGTSLHYLNGNKSYNSYGSNSNYHNRSTTYPYADSRTYNKDADTSTEVGTSSSDLEDEKGAGNIIDLSAKSLTAAALTKKDELSARLATDAVAQEDYLMEIEEYAKYYTIYDRYDRQVDYEEFKNMELDDKLNCLLVDPTTGQPLDPFEYLQQM